MPDLIAKGLTRLQAVRVKDMLKRFGVTDIYIYKNCGHDKLTTWKRYESVYNIVKEILLGKENLVIDTMYKSARKRGYKLKRGSFNQDIDALIEMGKLEKTAVERPWGGLKTTLSLPIEEDIAPCSTSTEEQVAQIKEMEGDKCDTKNMS